MRSAAAARMRSLRAGSRRRRGRPAVSGSDARRGHVDDRRHVPRPRPGPRPWRTRRAPPGRRRLRCPHVPSSPPSGRSDPPSAHAVNTSTRHGAPSAPSAGGRASRPPSARSTRAHPRRVVAAQVSHRSSSESTRKPRWSGAGSGEADSSQANAQPLPSASSEQSSHVLVPRRGAAVDFVETDEHRDLRDAVGKVSARRSAAPTTSTTPAAARSAPSSGTRSATRGTSGCRSRRPTAAGAAASSNWRWSARRPPPRAHRSCSCSSPTRSRRP